MPKTSNPEERLARIVVALRTVNEIHSLDDAVYDVRERRGGDDVDGQPYIGNSWEHPTVRRYSDAVTILREEGAL